MRLAGFYAILASLPALSAELELVRPPGIDFLHRNSPTSRKYVVETMCGGAALIDYNNDGLLDTFFVNGGRLDDPVTSPVRFSRHEPAFWNRLYRQNSDGSFTDVTLKAGLHREPDESYGMGAAAGDFDNDGFTDIYVVNYGRNTLYRNNGDGTFTDVTAKAGVAAGGWSVSSGFLDYDNDGRLDLFVTRYLDYDLINPILCGTMFRTYCRPGRFPRMSNILYRNQGGTFRDVSREAGIAELKATGMGLAIGDYDGDGFPDLFISNDAMEHTLWHNSGKGAFTDRALEAGVALSDDGQAVSGMGADFSDYDNDGRPDIVLTNLATEIWSLYRNQGNGTFSYTSLSTGLGALSARSSGWGVGWRDFDNDGWKDLFVARSHVIDNIERITPGVTYKETPFLALNSRGKLRPASIGGVEPAAGRAAAFGDLNNDGSMDVVMTVLNGKPVVLRNTAQSGNHWLILKLTGVRSNRDGFGAAVRVNGQYGYCTSTGSYLTAHDKRLHFGLGQARQARVEIRWPSGASQVLANVAADQIVNVKEP